MANSAVEDVVSVVAQIGRDANICSRSSSMPGYADQSRGPAQRLLLLPYTTTTHRQHQQFLRHPPSTYLAAESFSEAGNVLGGRWLLLPEAEGALLCRTRGTRL